MHKNRAHIFQSFDALKGFNEMLKEQEKIIVEPKILSEEDFYILDQKIKQIKKGMIVTLVYFDHNNYVQIEGVVSKINFQTKIIQIVKTKIDFKNIVDIDIQNGYD